MNTPIRWGILGAGNIAHKLAESVCIDPDSKLVAVASNTPGKAERFVEKYGTEIQGCSSYIELVTRDDIDVVYVATTHNLHFENTLLALEHDKHVLVEKPFTVNASDAEKLADLARSKSLFLMEAIWVRFLPSIRYLKSLLKEGVIGDLQYFNLSFGIPLDNKYSPRLLDPALAGGVTLDMGIYPITFINFMLDELPAQMSSMCLPAETGVDEVATYQFKYSCQCMASVGTSFRLKTRHEALIYGSKGYIEFPDFQHGDTFSIHTHNGSREIESSETVHIENHQNGFIYQVAEVADCLRKGKVESDTITLNETIATMKLMDSMREEWGLKYPFE